MHTRHITARRRGIAPLIIILLIAFALAAAGGAAYVMTGKKKTGVPGTQPSASDTGTGSDATGVDSLSVAAPSFEVPSTSALPKLEASALNLTSPNLPGTGIFKDFTANTDASYSYDLDVAVPEVTLDIPAPTASATGGSGSTSGSTGGSTGSSGGSQGQVTASNCAQFSSMPSAQYCSAVGDPNGKTLCEQCKAAGY